VLGGDVSVEEEDGQDGFNPIFVAVAQAPSLNVAHDGVTSENGGAHLGAFGVKKGFISGASKQVGIYA
jgi:hypothetical protein